ncbi:MAG: dTDP-4-amino-4,6-dideoxygalactose transaminase [Planctomycetota bacterium]|nr:dTDP-4-amino-4,6-dideoxygalactose transaminase [Planctomycetota bacterium]
MNSRYSDNMSPESIPFNYPYIAGKELYHIARAVMEGQLAGGGPYSRRCEEWLEDHLGAHRVLLTHSCTAALEMAAMLCDIGPGDEIILPSFTFVSTANAFALRGAKLVFVDIRPDTLNIDENQIEEAITPKTKAIVPVHYAGVGCEMDSILDIANRHAIRVIEDAAQGVCSYYNNRSLGTLGTLGCWSFHETKNFISGEGGALVINSPEFFERAEIIREKGTDRSKFFRGETDKYTWIELGSSYVPSELTAAFLFAQLEMSEEINNRRHTVFNYYQKRLQPLEEEGLVRLPSTPQECQHNAHMFYLILPSASMRNELLNHLKSNGINAVFHYIPLHESPMGQKLGTDSSRLPVTEEMSRRLLRLPLFYGMKPEAQDRTIEAIQEFLRSD